MDDTYKINAARTEMRDAYEAGDPDRLLSVFHPDGFIDMSEGSPNKYGGGARRGLVDEAAQLFAAYFVKFVPIVIEISVMDRMAYDRGWQEFVLTPRIGGEKLRKRFRYVNIWKKTAAGEWKIAVHINNTDIPENVGGTLSTWFLSDRESVANT